MNLYFYKKKSIHIRIQNYSHMKKFAVYLQIESYNWDLSSRSAGLKWGLPIGPTAHWSYDPLILRPIGPTAHWSYDPLVLRHNGPTTHWCYGP